MAADKNDSKVEYFDDGNGGVERAKGAYSGKKHINSNFIALGVIVLFAIATVVIATVTGSN